MLQKDWSARKLRTQISEKVVQVIRYVSDSGWERKMMNKEKWHIALRVTRVVTELKAVWHSIGTPNPGTGTIPGSDPSSAMWSKLLFLYR